MDRELLLEIGCEELPASWLPGLTHQIGEVVAAQLRAHRLPPEAPGGDLQHAAPADGPHRPPRRAPDRSRGAGHRPAGLGQLRRRRHADAGRRRLRREARRRGVGARARRDAEGHLPGVSAGSSAARRPSTCCPTCSAARCAALTFPKLMHWDARARRRPGRAAVRPADPLAPVPLRRPRRAVHDRAHAGGPERVRCRT